MPPTISRPNPLDEYIGGPEPRQAWSALTPVANQCRLSAFIVRRPVTISTARFHVQTQSGNMSAGIYADDGLGNLTLIAGTGPFAMPVAGAASQAIKGPPSAAAITDAFARTVSNGWGSTDVGASPWTSSGGLASDYAVAGGVGTAVAPANGSRMMQLQSVSLADVEVSGRVAIDKVPTDGVGGGSATAYVYLRHTYATDNDRYGALIAFASTGLASVSIQRRLAGASTTLTSGGSLAYAGGTFIRVRFRAHGSLLAVKIWLDGTTEPSAWTAVATDTNITAANAVSLNVFPASTTTNGPITVSWDDITVQDLSVGGAASVTLVPGIRYYAAKGIDNTTARLYGASPGVTSTFDAAERLECAIANALPLPAALVFDTTTSDSTAGPLLFFT